MTERINMRQTWNQISPHYQAEHKIPADFVHYGPHCPNEDELDQVRRLLEKLRQRGRDKGTKR